MQKRWPLLENSGPSFHRDGRQERRAEVSYLYGYCFLVPNNLGFRLQQGPNFDKAYMKAMLTGRQAQLSKFQQETAKSGTPGIADWAKQTLPALQNDLKASQKIAPAVGVKLPPANEGPTTRTEGAASSKPPSQNPY